MLRQLSYLTLALLTSRTVVAQPDLILLGANVFTAETAAQTAEAVALSGDRILAIGSNEEIRRLSGPQTRQVDLGGRTIIPGLIDAQVHLFNGS